MKRKKVFILLFIIFLLGCGGSSDHTEEKIDYREEMRNFVISISEYSKDKKQGFLIIPQNGVELITKNGEPDGELVYRYVNAIDGQGQEDLFYGYEEDNRETPEEDRNWLISFLDRLKEKGKTILVTDYCWDKEKIDNSYQKNYQKGYISLATCRELNCIPNYPPTPFHQNENDIQKLSDVRNFLYLINPENFETKEDFITALDETYYDLFIIDAFFKGELLTEEDINRLKTKPNGARRLVIAYMSIGEAENYRYYWDNDWYQNPPEWLEEENPDWEGNFKVKYWDKNWQSIIFGNKNSYLNKIISAGFDGVYLDIIDAYEYFEEKEYK